MIIEIDLNQTERHKNYCPYVIKNQHGEPILYLFGGIAASAAELVAKGGATLTLAAEKVAAQLSTWALR